MRHATTLTLNDAARAAIKAFRDAKPWRGDLTERGEKFANLHRALTRAYDMETILVRDDRDATGCSGGSATDLRTNKIMLTGRLSVVTYLFCFAAACGLRRSEAFAFAKDQFRHFFPRSFARCIEVNGMLRKIAS